jgi:hypothetical protein
MPTKSQPKLSEHRCGVCGRRLRQEQWVYSRHTGNRYCLPTVKDCRPKEKP